jgi:hypothetical protein
MVIITEISQMSSIWNLFASFVLHLVPLLSAHHSTHELVVELVNITNERPTLIDLASVCIFVEVLASAVSSI